MLKSHGKDVSNHIKLFNYSVLPFFLGFVVKVDGAEAPLVELLNMPRPFMQLKALDLDDIIGKL
jgi:hypothetical protein